ncbi:MAG: hypothetical protein K9L56_14600 [Clostridiales bacterium]|nr:hypothetical protein [Clostridiales bacterium]
MTGKYKEFKETVSDAKKSTPKVKAENNQLIEMPHKVDLPYQGKKREEDLEVDDPAHHILQKVRDEEIEPSDLSPDDKFVVIRYMREIEKKKQDDIAAELMVSRRTVINYCNKIKQFNAQKLSDTNIWELGGDIYQKALEAIEGALKDHKYKDVAYIISVMVSSLQSMGLVFKVPQKSQVQQQIMHDLQVHGAEGYSQMKKVADENEINIDAVFEEIMGAVKEGKLEESKEEDNGNTRNSENTEL